MSASDRAVGFGSEGYQLAFCIANRPPIDDYPHLNLLKPLVPGELDHIVGNTSNHWRKVFNVYAKFLMTLGDAPVQQWGSWQEYRDRRLLQADCREALLFSPPDTEKAEAIHIVAGKTYAAALGLNNLVWLDAHFAVDASRRLIVCPYLDYRQLSNERIERLAELVRQLRQQEPV
ncbi:hypothetical protein HBA55_30565 [Pseudomaricurvus alkylphenolicus]|uniref:DUF6942 family protein n=1 Tax=Pseudomaricurvus alkylphenolicus TaxID=1306991 RepID=UPI0014208A91|nr:hypothetical protein [Pseudomaricurvus alkylphenolicus]NIB43985.1 hypothetical protein [Pseudomaricurvus alkylphenolicus]